MDIVEEKKGKATLFHLSGRLDSANSSEVEQKILNSMDQGSKEVILNFEGLDYISSAGIRVLVHCHKEIEKIGGHIYLAAQPKPIENILYITGFLPYFKVFDTTAQALDAIDKD